MASRGYSGGIAGTTREVARLLDAFGFQVILVETVGSGQVDVEIRQVASTSVVVLVPHLGDEVQSLKAGLFEIADVFCVNKADLPGADGAARYLQEMAGLALRSDGWRPKVVQTSTIARSGIPQLWAAIEAHEAHLDSTGQRASAHRAQLQAEIVELARDSLVEHWSAGARPGPQAAPARGRGGATGGRSAHRRRPPPQRARDVAVPMTLPLWFLIAGILVIVVLGGYFFFGSFAFGAGYQPTPPKVVERMLEYAAIRPDELRLRSRGRAPAAIVFRAAHRFRARVVAVELEPIRVLILRLRRSLSSDRSRITIEWKDLFDVDLAPAQVVLLFLWPGAMARLKPRLESQLSPGGPSREPLASGPGLGSPRSATPRRGSTSTDGPSAAGRRPPARPRARRPKRRGRSR